MAFAAIKEISAGKTVKVNTDINQLCADLLTIFKKINPHLPIASKIGKFNSPYNKYGGQGDLMEEATVNQTVMRDVTIVKNLGPNLYDQVTMLKAKCKTEKYRGKFDILMTTGHKAKGLEWDNVSVSPEMELFDNFYKMPKRRLHIVRLERNNDENEKTISTKPMPCSDP